jgi:hypothetical protein
MSKPKAARDRLFKYGRPNIRPLVLQEEDGIGGDMRYLWGAYRKGSFPELTDMNQAEFVSHFIEYLNQFYAVWIVEDKNYHFPEGKGPVGLIVAQFDEWEMEPTFIPFKWITKRNVLKMVVAFFQMARYEKGIGILSLNSGEAGVDFLMKTAKRYNVIYYVGKIPRGNMGDTRYMFYGRGKDFFLRAS